MSSRRLIIIGILLILAVFFVGSYIAIYNKKQTDSLIRSTLLSEVKELALSIDPVAAQNLKFNVSDTLSADYQQIRRQMIAFGQLIFQRGIYSMALRDEKIVFGPENYLPDDPMGEGGPGTIFINPSSVDFSVFQTGTPAVMGPVKDEYGEFISALAPVTDLKTGKIIMVVGIDILAEDWQDALNKSMIIPVFASFFVVLILAAGIIIIWKRRNFSYELQYRFRHIETILVAILSLVMTGYFSYIGYNADKREKNYLFNLLAYKKLEKISDVLDKIKNEISLVTEFQLNPQVNKYNPAFQPGADLHYSNLFQYCVVDFSAPHSPEVLLRSDSAQKFDILIKSLLANNDLRLTKKTLYQPRFDSYIVSLKTSESEIKPYLVIFRPVSNPTEDKGQITSGNPGKFVVGFINPDLLLSGTGYDKWVNLHSICANIFSADLSGNWRDILGNSISNGDKKHISGLGSTNINTGKQRIMVFGDGLFALSITPSDTFREELHGNSFWLSIVSGFCLTALFTIFARYIRNQHFKLREMVESSTKELNVKINELVEAKKLVERSDKLKTAFLNNISHEVRTPLNGILGFTSMLLQDDISLDDKKEFHQMIKESTNRLTNTITNYMDIAILETNNYVLNPRELKPYQLLLNLYKKFQPGSQRKNIDIRLEVTDKDKEIIIFTDKELLEKALYQLIDNAVKFTHKGAVTIRFSKVSERVEFRVEDTGTGISKSAQKRVFEVFMQEEIAHTRGFEGSGLGLSISNDAVNLLGGELKVDSDKDRGSIFSFELPLKIIPLVEIKEKNDYKGSKYFSVLIADDDISHCLFIQKTLKKAGYRTYIVNDGSQAVVSVKSNRHINLVLMDIKMPVMDGLEAIKQIKAFNPALPVIGISGYKTESEQLLAFEAGCEDLIHKPVNKELLLKIISRFRE